MEVRVESMGVVVMMIVVVVVAAVVVVVVVVVVATVAIADRFCSEGFELAVTRSVCCISKGSLWRDEDRWKR